MEDVWLIVVSYNVIVMFPAIMQLVIEFIMGLKFDGIAFHLMTLHQKYLLTLVLITIVNKAFGLTGFFVTLLIYLLSSSFVNDWHKT